LPTILWIGAHLNREKLESFERKSTYKCIFSADRCPPLDAGDDSVRAIVIELPISTPVMQQAIAEARHLRVPIPVVVYDKDCDFDESLIEPPVLFHHISGIQSDENLIRLVQAAIQEAPARNPLAGPAPEPWRNLLVGESPAMRNLHAMIRLIAPRQSSVLISGETGTGKEMVARAIHAAGKRGGVPMVAVNCAAIPGNLVEAELFGHTKGAFTGAVNQRVGRFEQAHRGTIFLDEIGEIPLEVQPKLLRVLQERELQRVGDSETIQIDARVIAASNIDLGLAVEQKRFREDLHYRLNVVPIRIPPLRDRISDIPLLAEHFIEKLCRREELRPKTLSPDAMRRLMSYEWPGNVRQLEHAIEMSITLAGSRERLYAGDIQLQQRKGALPAVEPEINVPAAGIDFEQVIGRVENLLLQAALRKCAGNKAQAASMLGLKRTTLLYKVKAHEAVAS
jgi:transcriptional regulator with GAF, ATPase, and Fis domain